MGARNRREARAGDEAVRRPGRRGRPQPRRRARRVLQPPGALGLREDHHAPDDRGVRGPHVRSRPARRDRRHRAPCVPAGREHRVPVLRALPALRRVRQRGVRAPPEEGGEVGGRVACGRDAPAGRPPRLRAPPSEPALGRPAAARGPGPGPGERAPRAAPGRAARGARPEAPQADAAGAEADPAGGPDHVPVRDPRPGGGHDHVEPPGRDAAGADRADRRAGGRVRPAPHRVRRGVPGRVEPPVRRGEGTRRGRGHGAGGRRLRPRRARRPGARRPGEPQGRGPPGEDPHRGGERATARDRMERRGGRPPRRHVHRGQPPVHRGGARRGHAHGLRAEPRRGHRPPGGERVRLRWRPEHTFAVEAAATPSEGEEGVQS